ncbi:MAG: type I-E CRISPR-associated protein Cse2/CasB [Acidobacteria bacterium]|nr:type I-E CRISPR-associated protein Cse2/CasB [Acidobacteriota bacterium]
MNETATRAAGATLPSLVSSIARLIELPGVLTRGDVASLRRMDPRQPQAAFFKIEGLLLDDLLPGEAVARTEMETRWAAIVAGLAHLGSLHRPGARLGQALAAAELSEIRFARLVRADPEQLPDELPSLARFLRAKGVEVDWSAAADLALSAGTPRETDVRRHIARDYYGRVARSVND